MSDLFARVRPMVGDLLPERTVAVIGSSMAGPLVEYLVACGVQRWLILADNPWMDALLAQLSVRFLGNVDINLSVVDSVAAMGGVDLAVVVDDALLASQLPRTLPRLAIFTPQMGRPCCAHFAFAGESLDLRDVSFCAPTEHAQTELAMVAWDWHTAAPLMALLARAVLLRATPYAMVTWEAAWARGERAYRVGDEDDPTCAAWHGLTLDEARTHAAYRTPRRRRGTLLIAGLGSLGSVAARWLAPWVERLVLVDPDHVEVANLVRQHYTDAHVGEAKAVALAKMLGADAEDMHAPQAPAIYPVVDALTDDAQVTALIRRFGVTAALVTTGTQADFAIARAARAAGLPHVVGRCYARARFWEGIVVDECALAVGDDSAGLSYEQVRRAVTLGPTPAPTPEEVAAYGAVGELVGEPATAMETGWAASWLARLTVQMMTPVSLREGWLLARLAAGASCFVGGLVVEIGAEGAAYGVRVPGEVHAWSAAEIG